MLAVEFMERLSCVSTIPSGIVIARKRGNTRRRPLVQQRAYSVEQFRAVEIRDARNLLLRHLPAREPVQELGNTDNLFWLVDSPLALIAFVTARFRRSD
jgi:hypothetical protein